MCFDHRRGAGCVLRFPPHRDYAFLAVAGLPNVFFHLAEITQLVPCPGMWFEFNLLINRGANKGKPMAVDLTPCEPRETKEAPVDALKVTTTTLLAADAVEPVPPADPVAIAAMEQVARSVAEACLENAFAHDLV